MSFVSIVCGEPREITVKARYVVTVGGKTSEYIDEFKSIICGEPALN